MNWPGHLDYLEAIQHPQTCFRHERLKSAEVVCDRFGVPRTASGNFACVFQVEDGDGVQAVRCFTRPTTDHQRRYEKIAAFVARSRLDNFVSIDYRSEGILVRGNWYPILTMDWVDGTTIRTFVEQHLDQPEELKRLKAAWLDLAATLKQHGVAHGDIQHGNVLVGPGGQLYLIDYDAMYLPGFGGQASPELGHPNWQHPKRRPSDYHHDIDAFSSQVLTTSLTALIAEPALWSKFHNDENLLFARADFESPSESELFQAIKQLRGSGLADEVRKLERACSRPPQWPRARISTLIPQLKLRSVEAIKAGSRSLAPLRESVCAGISSAFAGSRRKLAILLRQRAPETLPAQDTADEIGTAGEDLHVSREPIAAVTPAPPQDLWWQDQLLPNAIKRKAPEEPPAPSGEEEAAQASPAETHLSWFQQLPLGLARRFSRAAFMRGFATIALLDVILLVLYLR